MVTPVSLSVCCDEQALQRIGFEIGTGVMIGLPTQTLDDLADDILFFRRENVDMIGCACATAPRPRCACSNATRSMGPYVLERRTPVGQMWLDAHPDVDMEAHRKHAFELSCRMIALTRCVQTAAR